jgi:hypothetical protein
MCTTLAKTYRVARKQHTRIWCGEEIVQGEAYIDARVVNDLACCVDTQRIHPECDGDLNDVLREEGGGCYYFMPYERPRPARVK